MSLATESIPISSYSAPEIYTAEHTHVFATSWVFVGMQSELAQPNDFITTTIGETPVVIQNIDGHIEALHNVCSHRKAPLQVEKNGNRPLRCTYHCWSYGAKGKIKSIPQHRGNFEYSQSELDALQLQQFNVAICGSFVFVRLSQHGPALLEYLGEYASVLETLSAHFVTSLDTGSYTWATNWKQAVETVLEVYHVPGVHPESFSKLAKPLCHVGRSQQHNHGHSELQTSPQTWWSGVRKRLHVKQLESLTEYNHFFIYPNLALGITNGSLLSVQTYEPQNPVETRLSYTLYIGKSTSDKPVSKALLAAVKDNITQFNHTTLEEDRVIAELCQKNLVPGTAPNQLGQCEERIIHFHESWQQQMTLALGAISHSSLQSTNMQSTHLQPANAQSFDSAQGTGLSDSNNPQGMSVLQPQISIAGRHIGPGHSPYIIAELSGNHGGSLDKALAMMEAVKASGADAIKIQTYTADTLTLDHDAPEFLLEGGLWQGRRLHELYNEAHTPWEWHAALFAKAKALSMTLFSSPFDNSAVELLESLDCPAYKIASFEMTDIGLLKRVAQTGKPLIISTGLATLSEIEEAVATVRAHGCTELALLHCISGYPTPMADCHLHTMVDFAQRFHIPIGFSDHTQGTLAAVTATALGANVLEKHFTLDTAEATVDSAFSLGTDDFTVMVKAVRESYSALGQVSYDMKDSETGGRGFRRSLYVSADIQAGELFTSGNIRSVRPAKGMHTRYYPDVLGQKATQDISFGTPLAPEMVAELSALYPNAEFAADPKIDTPKPTSGLSDITVKNMSQESS